MHYHQSFIVICYKDPYEPISFTECHKGFERWWHEDSKALGSGKVSPWVIHWKKKTSIQGGPLKGVVGPLWMAENKRGVITPYYLFRSYKSIIEVIALLIHPWSLTWNLKINPWKRRFLFETIIFRFHVKLWGCNWWGVHPVTSFPNTLPETNNKFAPEGGVAFKGDVLHFYPPPKN